MLVFLFDVGAFCEWCRYRIACLGAAGMESRDSVPDACSGLTSELLLVSAALMKSTSINQATVEDSDFNLQRSKSAKHPRVGARQTLVRPSSDPRQTLVRPYVRHYDRPYVLPHETHSH